MQFLHNLFTFFHVLCLFHSSNAKLKKIPDKPTSHLPNYSISQQSPIRRSTKTNPNFWTKQVSLISNSRPQTFSPFLSNKPDTNAINNLHKPQTKQPKNPIFSSFLLQSWENKKKMVDIHGFEGKKSWENRGKIDGSDLFGSWGKRRKIEVQRSIIKAEGLWVGVASSVIVLLEILPGFSLSQWLKNPSPFLSFVSTCHLFFTEKLGSCKYLKDKK